MKPPRHILGIEDLTTEEIKAIHSMARDIDRDPHASRPGRYDTLAGKVVYLVFGQESSRTRESFRTAVNSMGGEARLVDLDKSSVRKGESILDNLRMYEVNGADMIVLRCGYDLREAGLHKLKTPVVNAGDAVEHPTQALLDTLVMANAAGAEDFTQLTSNVLFVGHTRGYRSAQSLGLMLKKSFCSVSNLVPYDGQPMDSRYGLEAQNVIQLEQREMPWANVEDKDIQYGRLAHGGILTDEEVDWVRENRKKYMAQLTEAFKDVDFAYVCRPTFRGAMVHNLRLIERVVKPSMKLLHPLPRTHGELPEIFDYTERDLYLREQIRTGIRVRQATVASRMRQPVSIKKDL